jgi:anti-sigma regulatory factor (Ser/Thr protein kinase)
MSELRSPGDELASDQAVRVRATATDIDASPPTQFDLAGADGFELALDIDATAPAEAEEFLFAIDDLARMRRWVRCNAEEAGLEDERVEDLVLAVNELASNSIRHGGGHGLLEMWLADDRLICSVSDRGHIVSPPAGRIRPAADQLSGRGLWLVEELADRVEISSSLLDGSTVRISMYLT